MRSLKADAIKNSFQLNPEKCILFGSIGIVKGASYLGEITALMNKNVARGLGYGYAAIILTYCWIRVMRYLFIKGDIEAVEQELDALLLSAK